MAAATLNARLSDGHCAHVQVAHVIDSSVTFFNPAADDKVGADGCSHEEEQHERFDGDDEHAQRLRILEVG